MNEVRVEKRCPFSGRKRKEKERAAMMRVTLLRHPRSACAGLSLARAHARANGLLLRRRHQRRLNHAVVTRAAAQIGREEEEERGRARQAGRQAGSPSPQSRSLSLSLSRSVCRRNPLSRLDTFTQIRRYLCRRRGRILLTAE